MSPQQREQVLRGFADHKAKHGAQQIIRETSPRQGYWIDGAFYTDEAILKPFMAAFDKVKAERKLDEPFKPVL